MKPICIIWNKRERMEAMNLMAWLHKTVSPRSTRGLDITSPEELREYRCPLSGEPAFTGEESKDPASDVITTCTGGVAS